MSSPTSREPVGGPDGEKRIDSTATISGIEAMRIAVSDEEMCCSPTEISVNGMTISVAVYAAIGAAWPRSPRSAPRRAASGSSSTAASATRDHATKAGGTSASTATLMKKYGTPQITELAANSAHARALTGSSRAWQSSSRVAQSRDGYEATTEATTHIIQRRPVAQGPGRAPRQAGAREGRRAARADVRRLGLDRRAGPRLVAGRAGPALHGAAEVLLEPDDRLLVPDGARGLGAP